MEERRQETRYTIPDIYQNHITLKVKRESGEFAAVRLLNVSLRGIKIKDQSMAAVGSVMDCFISVPGSITKEIPFSARVAYCIEDKVDRSYLIGAEITQTSEYLWVNIFLRVHDFIDESLRV